VKPSRRLHSPSRWRSGLLAIGSQEITNSDRSSRHVLDITAALESGIEARCRSAMARALRERVRRSLCSSGRFEDVAEEHRGSGLHEASM